MESKKSKLYDLHDSTVNWVSELEFMKDEQVFLEHLLSTHFLDLSAENLYDATRKLIRKLKEVEKLGIELYNKIHKYNNEIGEVLETKETNENQIEKINKEYVDFKKDFENYNVKFKYVKKKIFGLIKEIMVHHKQKLLISKS